MEARTKQIRSLPSWGVAIEKVIPPNVTLVLSVHKENRSHQVRKG